MKKNLLIIFGLFLSSFINYADASCLTFFNEYVGYHRYLQIPESYTFDPVEYKNRINENFPGCDKMRSRDYQYSREDFSAEIINNDCNQYQSYGLIILAANGNINGVKTLLETKCNPDYQDSPYQNTALHLAVEQGNLDLVKLLLEYNANPTLKNNLQWDALSRAEYKFQQAPTDNNQAILHALKGDETDDETDSTISSTYKNESFLTVLAKFLGYL